MLRRCTPRLATFDYLGFHRYSLTCCTFHRRRLFESHEVVRAVLTNIAETAEQERFGILAYCFMPDHVHLLASGQDGSCRALAFIARAKQVSGYWYRRAHHQPLWQRSARDRVLRSDEDTLAVTRYILANPVRAGLVERPLDYPFSGSLTLDRSELEATLFDCGKD